MAQHKFKKMHLMTAGKYITLNKELEIDLSACDHITVLNIDCDEVAPEFLNRNQSVSLYAGQLRIVCNAALRCRTTGQHELHITTKLREKVDYV